MRKVISYPSPNYTRRSCEFLIEYLIIHYTACNLETSLKILTDENSNNRVSAHYLIDEQGSIYQLVDEEDQAWHAGVSYWNHHQNLNPWSIGIELVNLGHGPFYSYFPQAQMESLLALCHQILARHSISPCHILGHSDIAPGRKIDPGELFDWQWLARHGVGFYPPFKDLSVENRESPGVLQVQKVLKHIGYLVPLSGVLDPPTLDVIKAFQMHFLPESIDGCITSAFLRRLEDVSQGHRQLNMRE